MSGGFKLKFSQRLTGQLSYMGIDIIMVREHQLIMWGVKDKFSRHFGMDFELCNVKGKNSVVQQLQYADLNTLILLHMSGCHHQGKVYI